MERLLDITGVPKVDMFRSRKELLTEALTRQEKRIAYVDESKCITTLREDSP